MTVYDIAVGAFIALLVRDIISLIASEIARYISDRKYERELDEFMDNLDLELQEIRKTKKKTVKKKS
jgi:hypothetical protein